MTAEENHARPTVGVGAVIFRDDDVLLIKRGKEPFLGMWSIPGGRLQFGESLEAAVRREVREETGLEMTQVEFLGVFEALPEEVGGAAHMVLVDYMAEWAGGEPVAGDDAAAAEFVPFDEAMARLSWDKTRLALTRALEIRRSAAKSL